MTALVAATPASAPDFAVGGRIPLLLCLGAFLITFALTRLYTRLARVRGWGSGSLAGGVHLHHMVVGILFILVTGLLTVAFFPGSPWRELLAVFFGIGAALTLDEFALWLYLRDVYWCPEGRSSIDATVMGIVLACLLLVGTAPFGVDGTAHAEMRAAAFGMVAFNVIVAVITLMKGKLLLGIVSVFLPVVGIVGAVRLAKPRSLWTKHVYGEEKRARAVTRYEGSRARYRRFHDRFDDALGGAPTWVAGRMPLDVIGGCLVPRRK